MKLFLSLFLFCSSCFGYTWRGQVDLGAAPSGTLSNITLATATVSDVHLKTVANGGTINDATCTHVISNVPCDFRVTDDPACGVGGTAFKWGFETYDGTAGTARLWILVPLLGTSHVMPYVCAGDPTVHSYEGGSAGAEFDSNTKLALHFPDGSTLSATDFSSTGNAGVISGASAGQGEIDGGASLNGSTNKITFAQVIAAGTSAFTYECWINPTRYGSAFFGNGFFYQGSGSADLGNALAVFDGSPAHGLDWSLGPSTHLKSNSNVITLNAWQHVAFVYGSGTGTFYVNALNAGGGSGTSVVNNNSASIGFWYSSTDPQRYFAGGLDECRFSSTNRPPVWIAAEVANQSNPPAITSWTNLNALSVFVPSNIY